MSFVNLSCIYIIIIDPSIEDDTYVINIITNNFFVSFDISLLFLSFLSITDFLLSVTPFITSITA